MDPQPDIGARDVRATLPQRYRPYWRIITLSRHIGYQKRDAAGHWVARYRTTDRAYRQRRIGLANDRALADGVKVLSFDQAVVKAGEWFAACRDRQDLSSTIRVETTRRLNFSPVGSEFTIGRALHDYVEWKRLASTVEHVKSMLSVINRYVVPRFASLLPADLSQDRIRQFVQHVLEVAPRRGSQRLGMRVDLATLDSESLRKRKKTANTLLGYLRNALRMAWENEKIDSDRIWRRIGRFRGVDRPRVLHLSREECRRLLTHCREDLRDLVLGALYTGCRPIELCKMRCSQVGRDGYGVYVSPSKTYRPRFVFLPDEGMAWFLALVRGRAAGELVFKTRLGRRWRGGASYNRVFSEAVKAAELPADFTFHGLRHTYASQLVQAGAPVFAIADQLGHSNPATVMRTYGHLSPQIRESEVRQRFTVLDIKNAKNASRQARSLKEWRSSMHGREWRTYARISDVSSRLNTEEGLRLASPTKKQLRDRVPPGQDL